MLGTEQNSHNYFHMLHIFCFPQVTYPAYIILVVQMKLSKLLTKTCWVLRKIHSKRMRTSVPSISPTQHNRPFSGTKAQKAS